MSHQKTNRQLRRRERAAAEELLNDPALREELDDDQATHLLEWGFGVLSRRVSGTAPLPDSEAVEAIGPVVNQVKTVMRLVNELVARLPRLDDDDEAAALAGRFLTALAPLQTMPAAVREALPAAVAARKKLGRAGTFNRLLAILMTTPDNLTTVDD